MVISDTDTRWNSTYLSITRAIKLYAKIQVYSEINRDALGPDLLLPSDWVIIREMQQYLSLFQQYTLDLESQATFGTHGAIQEALPPIEFLLTHLETLKQTLPTLKKRIRECVLNSQVLIRKYYDISDQSHSIYAAATLLNPLYRLAYFKKNWIGESAAWVDIMKDTCWNVWKDEYLPYAPKIQAEKPQKMLFNFRNQIHDQIESEPSTDDDVDKFVNYSTV